MRSLIIGCGYLGRRVADLWVAAGQEVHALTRAPANATALQEAGIRAVVGDVLDPASLEQLPDADTMLYAVGYDRATPLSKRDIYVNGLRNVLKAVDGQVGRVIYISSTSVYGQVDGSWIDEESPTEPETEGGRICLDAEHVLRASSTSESTVLRLAGIYGPGRLIGRVDRLRSGAPVAGRPDAWLNLIHVDDAARCVLACSEGRAGRPLYLIVDDKPVRREEFYAELAGRIGAPPPTFDPDGISGRHVSGLGKRCRNALLHRDLLGELSFPDFHSGLAASI